MWWTGPIWPRDPMRARRIGGDDAATTGSHLAGGRAAGPAAVVAVLRGAAAAGRPAGRPAPVVPARGGGRPPGRRAAAPPAGVRQPVGALAQSVEATTAPVASSMSM